jgi:hypothetical protein
VPCRDYEAKSGLDQYEAEGLDEDFEDDMDYAEAAEARRRAEEEIEAREGGRRRKRRLPGALEGEAAPASCSDNSRDSTRQ